MNRKDLTMNLPDAFLVVYQRNGVESSYVALDRFVAEEFAIKYRGIIHPLYKEQS